MILMIMMFIFMMLTLLLIILNLMISKKKKLNREKLSPYECGFDPFNSARLPFSIQFYLIGIIFLIFDVEIVIFLPMIYLFLLNKFMSWKETSLIFIMILLIGLYMEWNNGAFTWLK